MTQQYHLGQSLNKTVIALFLTENPFDTVKKGKIANVPVMAGIVSGEGAYKTAAIFKNSTALQALNENFNEVIATSYDITSSTAASTNILRKFYFGKNKIDVSTIHNLTNMYTDGWFLLGLDATVRAHLEHVNQPIYKYLFDYRGSLSYTTIFGATKYDFGVCHTDELLYLLPQSRIYQNYFPTKNDQKMINVMTTLWTNFAKTGNPTSESEDIISAKWLPVRNEKQAYLRIKTASDLKMEENLFYERIKLWKTIPLNINDL